MKLCVLLAVGFATAAGQTQTQPGSIRLSHRITASPAVTASVASSDTIHLLVCLVDFARDNDPQTTGDGSFLLTRADAWRIDPPPHDASYFRRKFLFLQNYFSKSSGGRCIVSADVSDSVVTLSGTMRDYSPPTIGNDNTLLARFAAQAWARIDSVVPAIPWNRYQAFALVHAGTGRDVDLVSLLGYNPSPSDIPSLVLDSAAFSTAFNDPAFAGIPVAGGTVRIKSTMILPEMESRVLGFGTNVDTVMLSTNGLIAASFGTILGLPDLFDTKTGRSGIGQFGLMDGASIFAYAGLFPPEPSAWEKQALGWVTPILVTGSTAGLSLPAVGWHFAQDTIYRIPISEDEYFLVENRARDVHGDGATFTMYHPEGLVDAFHVFRDTAGFNLYNVSLTRGTVIDVDEFDWALPGVIDTTGRYDGGGILIWHIDERVIRAGRNSNQVNADPDHRGVNLEEADGSPDIGQVYDQFTAGSGNEYGSPLDCWYRGNLAVPYRNRFDDVSNPSSRSNAGAPTLIALGNFSSRSPHMTFDATFGVPDVTPIATLRRSIPGLVDGPVPADLNGDGVPEFLATLNTSTAPRGGLMAWHQDGNRFIPAGDPSGVSALTDSATVKGTLVAEQLPSGHARCAVVADGVYLWSSEDLNADGRFDLVRKIAWDPSRISRLMFVGNALLVIGRDSVAAYDSMGTKMNAVVGSFAARQTAFCTLGGSSFIVAANGDSLLFLSPFTGEVRARKALGDSVLGVASAPSADAGTVVVATTRGGEIAALDSNGTILFRSFHPAARWNPEVVLVDVNNDGKPEVVLTGPAGIETYTLTGSLADGFPVRVAPDSLSATQGVIAVDVKGNNRPALLTVSASGTLLWLSDEGGKRVVREISAAGGSASSLACFPVSTAGGTNLGIALGDDHGWTQAFDLQQPYAAGKVPWAMRFAGADGTGAGRVAASSPQPLSSEFLPAERVYNWPNPVYGSSTNIRYYSAANADVSVRIVDLAGSAVAELHGTAVAGMDGEILWDVSGIQSGVYLARVELRSASRSAVRIIKIAVVK